MVPRQLPNWNVGRRCEARSDRSAQPDSTPRGQQREHSLTDEVMDERDPAGMVCFDNEQPCPLCGIERPANLDSVDTGDFGEQFE